jgi:hypothetical protein
MQQQRGRGRKARASRKGGLGAERSPRAALLRRRVLRIGEPTRLRLRRAAHTAFSSASGRVGARGRTREGGRDGRPSTSRRTIPLPWSASDGCRGPEVAAGPFSHRPSVSSASYRPPRASLRPVRSRSPPPFLFLEVIGRLKRSRSAATACASGQWFFWKPFSSWQIFFKSRRARARTPLCLQKEHLYRAL